MSVFPIIFQNEEIIIVNKPNGVPVQGGEKIFHPLDKELSIQQGCPVHLVHRLDKDTAGLLVVAKNAAAASKWTRLIGEKSVKKEYTAFCLGVPLVKGRPCKEGQRGILQDVVSVHGKNCSAELFFTPEKSAALTCADGEEITLCKVKIVLGTGRMHQIRIQFAKASAPLAADDQHGNFKLNKKIRRFGIKKLCLAATKLTLPLDGSLKVFTAPLPPHMEEIEKKYFISSLKDSPACAKDGQ